MNIHHLGIVVNKLSESMCIYEQMGYRKISDIIFDDNQNNNILFMKSENLTIELIEPANDNSSVKNANGYHHICYEVENLDEFCSQFKGKKLGVVFTNKLNAPALDNRYIAFAYLKSGVIVEFLENASR